MTNVDLKNSVFLKSLPEFMGVYGWKPAATLPDGSPVYSNGKETFSLPINTDYVDFDDRYWDVLTRFGRKIKRSAKELYLELLTPPRDLYEYAIHGTPTDDGTVSAPIYAAVTQQMYATLALATKGVVLEGGKKRLSQEEQKKLLAMCRYGQTKVGSFVSTVFVPIEPGNAQMTMDDVNFLAQAQVQQPNRQVSLLMQHSAHEVTRTIASGKLSSNIEQNGIVGSIAEKICQTYETIHQHDSKLSLRLSASPSSFVPTPPSLVLESVSLTPTIIRGVTDLKKELSAKREQKLKGPFHGFITGLGRPSLDPNSGGTITVVALLEGDKTRKLTCTVDAADYTSALHIHEDCLPVTIEGEVTKQTQRTISIEQAKLKTSQT